MRIEKVPKVLGLIPDGNRRWSRRNSLSFFNGYRLGVKKFIEFAEWCGSYGINNITVWAFSTENFARPLAERKALFELYKRAATDDEIKSMLHNNNTKLNIVGDRKMLPSDLQRALHKLEIETKDYKKTTVNMLIPYGGKQDILHAATSLVNRAIKKHTRRITESMFKAMMYSSIIPEIDFVIRTAGEERLSGFMPWQTAYSELYFSRKYWPDFTKRDLQRALQSYERRQRRFGN